MKHKYYIPLTTNDNLSNLETEFSLTVVFNPLGDGNCQFSAIAYQLRHFGIHRSAATLRADVISYLQGHSHLGNGGCWNESLCEARPSYLARMAKEHEYGDQITLQAISQLFNIQILIVSTLNDGTTLISSTGEPVLNQSLPLIVLGHYAEGQGEHFVALDDNRENVLNIVRNSQIHLLDDLSTDLLASPDCNTIDMDTTCHANSVEEESTHSTIHCPTHARGTQEIRNVPTNFYSVSSDFIPMVTLPDTNNNSPTHVSAKCTADLQDILPVVDANSFPSGLLLCHLPEHIIEKVVSFAISLDFCLIGILQSAFSESLFLRDLVQNLPGLPIIHVNMDILKDLEGVADLCEGTRCEWSIARLIRLAGRSSGLILALIRYFCSFTQWHQSQIVVMATRNPGEFKVIDVLPQKGWFLG